VACFSQDGRTALIRAAIKGHNNVVSMLLGVGANIEAADNVIDIIISKLIIYFFIFNLTLNVNCFSR